MTLSLFLFQSSTEPAVFGFTADIGGANLPAELAPWLNYGSAHDVIGGKAVTSAGFASAVMAAVQQAGFYLARG